jgi:two component, sigma54 specific, transcriptional regulator, Fis family
MAKTILIVDDDPTQRRLLQAAIERHGFHARLASDGQTGVEAALSGLPCDLVLLDLVMPGFSGMEALAAIRAQKPALPVIVLTAHGGLDSVVAAMQAGANDFLVKPASPERLIVSVRNALKVNELTGEVSRLKKKAANEITFADLIATAPAMRNVVRMGKRAAASSIPVLILGESGVGKEMIARAIQGESDRAGRPFVTVNCGALPENLVESIFIWP